MRTPAHLEPKALLAMSLYHANKRLPHRREDAEDAAGHAVLVVLESARKNPEKFESVPYTRTAIMLAVVDFYRGWSKYSRTQRKAPPAPLRFEDVTEVDRSGTSLPLADQIADPESTRFAESLGDRQHAASILATLKAKCPSAVPVVLRLVEGESTADIARSDGVAPGTMSQRLWDMRRRMAEFHPDRRAA